MPVINEYHRPENIAEALRVLTRENQRTKVLAGGTNLGSSEFMGVDAVVDLQALGLNQVSIGSDQIVLGAMVRIKEIVQNPGIPPLLSKMARRDGPNTQRNAGTIGGAIVEADWESELYATLLVHGASVTIQTVDGRQEMSLQNFSQDLVERGLVISVSLDPGGATADARVARTPADSPIVAVVGRKNAAGDVQLAFCGISKQPIMANLEDLAGITPPSDFRGSSAYRREMAIILGKRVLEQLSKQ
jgi:CO/xanthine dehydrogenase FAD-binding subunit